MTKNYAELIKNLRQRSNPESVLIAKMFSETLSGSKLYENSEVEYSDVSIYIRDSMRGVAPEFTMNSKVAANMVEAHLKKSHGSHVHFERQGSVMSNTHILKDNDVDLVQITNKSSKFDSDGLEKALSNPSNLKTDEIQNLKKHKANFKEYKGNQLLDLEALRDKSEKILKSVYKEVDDKKDNSIYVKVSNPERDIDVVTATYYKGVEYLKSNQKHKRGVRVYNKSTKSLGSPDFPFLSIERINVRDMVAGRRLKNMIRFLKNLKYDCPRINNEGAIRSFHINAICYNISIKKYENLHYIDLVCVLNEELQEILNNKEYRESIKSVDDSESIFFGNYSDKLKEIDLLQQEIDSILADLSNQKLLIG